MNFEDVFKITLIFLNCNVLMSKEDNGRVRILSAVAIIFLLLSFL